MLNENFRWLPDTPEASFLHWRYACVGSVYLRDGEWFTRIRWAQRDIDCRCGSREQGKRWVTRFFAARGAPSRVKRRPSQPPRRLFPTILE